MTSPPVTKADQAAAMFITEQHEDICVEEDSRSS